MKVESDFILQLHPLQKIKYRAKGSKNKSDKSVLKREDVEGCEAGEEREFDVNIIVPTVPPSFSICNIIKIQYFIRVGESFYFDSFLKISTE